MGINLLTRADLLKRQNLKIEKVSLGEGFVYVREMTGSERDAFEQSLIRIDNKGNMERTLGDFRAKLAVYSVCDDKGNLIFKPDDYKALGQNLKASWLERIVNTAQSLSAISEKDVEEMVKNSNDTQSESSISD